MPESTKGGNVTLKSLNVPDSVRPGDLITVEVVMENHATIIGPFDPDRCGTAPPGYRTQAEVRMPDGSTRTDGPDCVAPTQIGEHTFTVDVTVPEAIGDYSIQARLSLPESGKQTGWVSTTITVSEQEATEPESDTENAGNGFQLPGMGGGGGGGPVSPLSGINSTAQIGLAVLALVAIAWIADSGAEVAG